MFSIILIAKFILWKNKSKSEFYGIGEKKGEKEKKRGGGYNFILHFLNSLAHLMRKANFTKWRKEKEKGGRG